MLFRSDGGNGRRAEIEMVGDQYDVAFVFHIPNADATKRFGTRLTGLFAGQYNDFIRDNVAVLRNVAFFNNLIERIVLHAGHKEDPRLAPRGKQLIIVVGAIHGHDGARIETQHGQYARVMQVGIADVDKGGHVIGVVQQNVRFDAALGASKCRQGNRERHRETVVESSESSLFLKRNLCFLAPNAPLSRKWFREAQKRSSYNLADRCALA